MKPFTNCDGCCDYCPATTCEDRKTEHIPTHTTTIPEDYGIDAEFATEPIIIYKNHPRTVKYATVEVDLDSSRPTGS